MAVKDRITKKTTTKTTTVKRKTRIRSGIDVLDFFEMNKSISGLFIYDNNKIYVEQDGLTQKSDEAFDISLSDLIRVIVTKYENNFISVGDSYVVETENGTIINIVSKPYLKAGSFISFRKKRNYEYSIDYFMKRQIMNYDISDYLLQKVRNGENIFVVGSGLTDKHPVLSYISELGGTENTAIIQGTEDILTETPNSLVFSKHSLPFKDVVQKAFELNHNFIVLECDNIPELMKVFEYINAGFKHFCSAFNTNSRKDFVNNLKNNIMLNYPEMSESKIEGLIASTIKNIVFLEKMKDGETRISHVSELTTKDGEIKIEDIFVFDFARFGFVKGETEEETEEIKPKIRKQKKVLLKRKSIKREVKDLPVIEPVANILEEEAPEVIEIQQEENEINQHEVMAVIEAEPAESQEIEPEPLPQIPAPTEETAIQPEPQPSEPAVENIIPQPPEQIIVHEQAEERAEETVNQLTEKVNKYKLLKEKLKHKREQNN